MDRISLATAGALLCAVASIGSSATAHASSLDYQKGSSGYGGRGHQGYGSACNHSARVYSWKAPKAQLVLKNSGPGRSLKAAPDSEIDRDEAERDIPVQEPGLSREEAIETGALPQHPGGTGIKEVKPSKSSAAPAIDRGKAERAQAATVPPTARAAATAKPQLPMRQTVQAALPDGLRSQTTSISPDQFLDRCTKAGGDASGNGETGTACEMPNGEKANCIWAEKAGRWLGSCIAREVN